jgi:hypothetical protein
MTGPARDPGVTSPWRSIPLLWFVVGLPLTAVIAAFVTLGIAVRSHDEVVRDDFRREGLAIHADPARDQAATALGATASLSVEPAEGRISVELALERGASPDELLLVLSHATLAANDRLVRLRRDNGRYQGATAALPAGHWYVEITPPDRSWRLRCDFRDAAARLRVTPPGVS